MNISRKDTGTYYGADAYLSKSQDYLGQGTKLIIYVTGGVQETHIQMFYSITYEQLKTE